MKRGKFLALLTGSLATPFVVSEVLNNEPERLKPTVTFRGEQIANIESWCKDDFTAQLTGEYNHLAQKWLENET